jgi:hypothetical protein
MIIRDAILERLGLQRRMGAVDYILPALGLFGVGIMVGAGLGLMFAPKPGNELRTDLSRVAGNVAGKIRRRKGQAMEELTGEEVFGDMESGRTRMESHPTGSSSH